MSNASCIASPLPKVAFRARVAHPSALLRLVMRLQDWHERARGRRVLLSLNDQQLRDIGLSRADAEREGLRPFWDC